MLEVVCWKWRGNGRWKRYGAEHVNALAGGLERHLSVPFRLTCITDDTEGIRGGIHVLPLDEFAAPLPSQEKVPLRNCYRKIGFFNPALAKTLDAALMLQLDLDQVITGPIGHLVSRPEDLVIWRSPSRGWRGWALNTSVVLYRPGTRDDIWWRYLEAPKECAARAGAEGYTGTDQAVVALLAGSGVATFTDQDGILSYRDDLRGGLRGLPLSARIVSFFDRFALDDPKVQQLSPWIVRHWR